MIRLHLGNHTSRFRRLVWWLPAAASVAVALVLVAVTPRTAARPDPAMHTAGIVGMAVGMVSDR